MLIVNFLLGVTGLILAGDSLGRGIRIRSTSIMAIGGIELLAGLYFIIATIGSGSV